MSLYPQNFRGHFFQSVNTNYVCQLLLGKMQTLQRRTGGLAVQGALNERIWNVRKQN